MFGKCEDFPLECLSQNSLHASISENSYEAVLAHAVAEKHAPVVAQRPLLRCTGALVTQPSESAVTRQKMNVPGIEDFTVWSPELFRGACLPAIQKIACSKNHSAFTCLRVGIGNYDVVFLLGHHAAGCAH